MSQGKFLKLLKKSKKPLTIKEISKKLKINQNCACSNALKLLKWKEVKRRIKKESNSREYEYYL